jgi:hypothetical protein
MTKIRQMPYVQLSFDLACMSRPQTRKVLKLEDVQCIGSGCKATERHAARHVVRVQIVMYSCLQLSIHHITALSPHNPGERCHVLVAAIAFLMT